MTFKEWLLAQEAHQLLFPFATEEPAPDLKKIKRFKSQDNYVDAMSKGGRKTEIAAEKLINLPINSRSIGMGGETLIELAPKALTIPAYTFPGGKVRPEWYVAFAHVKSNEPANPNDSYYNRPRHRILAFYQGQNPRFTKDEALDPHARPLGGLSFIGNDIDVAWIAPDWRGSNEGANVPSLYKALREFAKARGAVTLKSGDDLTSTSFRAAQAKYDWKRAQEMLKANNSTGLGNTNPTKSKSPGKIQASHATQLPSSDQNDLSSR